MTTAARTAGERMTTETKPRRKSAAKAVGGRVGKWWRRSWYKVGRGRLLRSVVRLARWHETAQRGTFASTRQTPALTPILTDTHPIPAGPPLGVDLLTNQAVLENCRGLYQGGFVTSPNEAIVGGIGTAKSTYVKINLLRSIVVGGRGVVFDRKRQQQSDDYGTVIGGEYAKLTAAVSGMRIRCHQDPQFGTRINVLDPAISALTAAGESSTLGQDRLLIMVAEAALEEKLDVYQRSALLEAHKAAVRLAAAAGRVPVLADVIEQLQHPAGGEIVGVTQDRTREWGLPLVLALKRYVDGGDLSGLIDGETSGPGGEPVTFDSPLLVFDTSALEYGSTALGVMMAVTTAFLMSVWINVPGPKTVVVEEAYSADGVGVIPSMFRDLSKRTRGVGASMLSVFHHVSDVAAGSPMASLITESEVVCVFRQDKGADADAVMDLLSLDTSLRDMIMTLPRGVHIRKRGARLPVSVVETYRTSLEKHVTFTDDALL